jgi:hypothetical protein
MGKYIMFKKFFIKIKYLNDNKSLDAKFWIQKLLLKKSLNSFKLNNF